LKKEATWLCEALGDRACAILTASDMDVEPVRGISSAACSIPMVASFTRSISCLGIAAGLKKAGIDIFENTPVTGLRNARVQGVLLQTPGGTITAGQVVIATNSYSDLTSATSAVRKAIIPFRSAMIATAPLSDTPGANLLARGRSYTETRRMMRWFRKVGDRLLYGGRGAFGKTDSQERLHGPAQGDGAAVPGACRCVAVTHRWSGLVAMTMDSIPHVGRLDDRIVYAVGYNGTGVALASNMGKHVAAILAGESPDLGLLTSERLKPVPFYPIREPAVRLVAGWYQFLDAIGR
jgi:gamma-glutamylputrescine oxidase